ncbi:MAG: hypothetical protein IPK50_08945 [Fibrobacterota bacterium]|nr:MAG: hypothetical protein IPK50_08945 [Fibrobacterota bacterium]
MKIQHLAFASLLALASCNGPWNLMPSDEVNREPTLFVSLFAIGDRNFDTLWLERTIPLAGKYDSTMKFVEDASIVVSREGDPTDSVSYLPAPGSAVAWLPSHPHPVVAGATYTLRARVRWNASQNWPGANSTRVTELSATTTVPTSWSVSDSIQAPVEAMVSVLAVGARYPAEQRTLDIADSLVPGVVARYRLTTATIDSVNQGLPTFRKIPSGDTVWYIPTLFPRVTNISGVEVAFAFRDYVVELKPGAGFGGGFGVHRFDPTRARIDNPVSQTQRAARGNQKTSTQDSARRFQPGNSRYLFGPAGSYESSLYRWPQIALVSNLTLDYTGPNWLVFYAVDPNYVSYNRAMNGIAGGDRTTIPYTNIRGGSGYFAGALADSVMLYVRSTTKDTLSIQALRGAACRIAWKNKVENGDAFDAVFCAGTDYKAAPVGSTGDGPR